MLSEDLIEKVKSANPIEDVVAEYQSLSKRGANLWGLCPFHADRHPSMSVSPLRQIFKCFVCGEGGNAFKYVQQVEGVRDVTIRSGHIYTYNDGSQHHFTDFVQNFTSHAGHFALGGTNQSYDIRCYEPDENS